MKILNFIRLLFLCIIGSYLIYASYIFLTKPTHPTYLDCGVVMSKSSDEIAIKNGSRTDLYLNIQFEKSGFKSINTVPTTYFGTKVGQKVCFDLNANETAFDFWTKVTGLTVLFLLSVIGFVLFIVFLVSWESKKEGETK